MRLIISHTEEIEYIPSVTTVRNLFTIPVRHVRKKCENAGARNDGVSGCYKTENVRVNVTMRCIRESLFPLGSNKYYIFVCARACACVWVLCTTILYSGAVYGVHSHISTRRYHRDAVHVRYGCTYSHETLRYEKSWTGFILYLHNTTVYSNLLFRGVRKIAKIYCGLRHICLSVRMEKLCSHWTDFD